MITFSLHIENINKAHSTSISAFKGSTFAVTAFLHSSNKNADRLLRESALFTLWGSSHITLPVVESSGHEWAADALS